MNSYLKKLKCLGDQTRIRILKLIIKADMELCVCEIVDSLQIPFYTVSKHIKELKNAEILNETKDGTFVMYSLKKNTECFFSIFIDLINSIPDDIFLSDINLLEVRLSKREDGKCIVGLRKDKLL